MEKKMTKVVRDKVQTRTTIPQRFVDKHEVTSDHKIEWESKGRHLKGTLVDPELSSKSNKTKGELK